MTFSERLSPQNGQQGSREFLNTGTNDGALLVIVDSSISISSHYGHNRQGTMKSDTFQTSRPRMPRIIFMSRGEYLRMFVLGFACGFFSYQWMARSASPRWQSWIDTAVTIAVLIATFVPFMRRRKGPLEEP